MQSRGAGRNSSERVKIWRRFPLRQGYGGQGRKIARPFHEPESPCEGNRVFRCAVFPPGRMPGSTAGKMPATTTEIGRRRLPILDHRSGSWSQCMRKTERGLSMNLGDRVHAERKIGLFNRREHIEHKTGKTKGRRGILTAKYPKNAKKRADENVSRGGKPGDLTA